MSELISSQAVKDSSATGDHMDLLIEPSGPISKARDMQHPNWCFTFNYGGENQPSREVVERFLDLLNSKAQYLVVGFEKAPGTGQLHAQGYIQLSGRARLKQLKALPDGYTVHWEVAKADEITNTEYCLKSCGSDFVQCGEPRQLNAGLREKKNWETTKQLAIAGKLSEVSAQIYVQHYSSLKRIAQDHLKMGSDLSDVCGTWYYGPSGCGKSRHARTLCEADQLYLKPVNKWWDGYRGQTHVLLEDVDPHHSVLAYHFKIWADRYAFPAEVKGSTIAIRPQELMITSQYHPREIFTDPEDLAAIQRRFTLRWMGSLPNPYEAEVNLPVSSSTLPMEPTIPRAAQILNQFRVQSARSLSQTMPPVTDPSGTTSDSETILLSAGSRASTTPATSGASPTTTASASTVTSESAKDTLVRVSPVPSVSLNTLERSPDEMSDCCGLRIEAPTPRPVRLTRSKTISLSRGESPLPFG